jgi:hypothetical protein
MTEVDCHTCRNWRDCPGLREWFNYSEIRFCPYQVIWVIRWADILRTGDWPQDPDGGGDDNHGQRSIKTEAGFVKPSLILAEVESRLQRTGKDGKILRYQIEAMDSRYNPLVLCMVYDRLDRDARTALLYVKGWRQKKMCFADWKRQRKYRRNDYQNVVKGVSA